MGQTQVKIPTSNHIATLVLNKQNRLEISVHSCDQNRQLSLEYYQSYMFLQLPQDTQQQFQSMKNLFKNVSDSQGLCCTGGNGHYRVEFQEGGKLIIKKHSGKQLIVHVDKIAGDSWSNMTIQLQQKVVSLQDRLERQTMNNKKNQFSLKMTGGSAANTQLISLQKQFFKLQKGFYLSLFNLKCNILQSINQSALKSMIITQMDLIGNNLTTKDLNQLLKLNWVSLKKLWLDDNLIDKTNGLEKLNKLKYLSLSKNLFKLEAAQHLSKNKFNELIFLKISFISSKQDVKCWQVLWSNEGRNMPRLQKLVIISNKMLAQNLKKKYQLWSEYKRQQLKRQLVFDMKDLSKISQQKISSLNRINTLNQYPQLY